MTKAKAITNELSVNINFQRTLFRVLVGSLIALSVVYVYLIGSITFNIVARRSLENTAASLTNSVNQLNLTYLDNINKIDENYAKAKGFVEVNQNIFASRDANRVAIR